MQALASNAVVAEVAEDVGEVSQAVVFSTEAQVALIVEPGRHGTAAGHKHPLPNVKLPVDTHTHIQIITLPCLLHHMHRTDDRLRHGLCTSIGV